MFKPIKRFGEFVSLSVMLLLVVALVASQADARNPQQARSALAVEQTQDPKDSSAPLKTTIKAHIIGQPLTISVDPASGFGKLRFIFK